MAYESDILKRLIKTYGVVGNPRYISEIIKEFIVRGKERFPELFTYQADWLAHIDEFGLNPTYTVSYTGQSIYAPNTLERPVKSAILSGSTKYRDIDTGEVLDAFEEGRNLELVSVKMPVLRATGKNLWSGENIAVKKYIDATGAIVDADTDFLSDFIKVKPNTTYSFRVMDSRATNPYGIKSFFDKNKKFIKRGNGNHSNNVPFTTPSNCHYVRIHSNSYKDCGNTIPNCMLVETDSKPSTLTYEPYKSNILTTNEEVELRGIGKGSNRVEDELDLMTGEKIERIGEIVLDGNIRIDKQSIHEINNTLYVITFTIPGLNGITGNYNFNTCITDKFNTYYGFLHLIQGDWGEGVAINDRYIRVVINSDKLPSLDTTGINSYFAEHPLTVCYKLAKESIKTVDLTILDQNGQNVKQLMSFNGGTHFNTSSQDGSLLPSLIVDVVTNLEETLRVCSLEGNTM